jgi:EAL and modified HD-GYP domain-containing signal transduction protein
MSTSNLLLIHPLLGTTDAWSGYLVEAAAQSALNNPAVQALCENPLLDEFDGRHPWFIPATGTQNKRFVPVFAPTWSEAEKTLEASLRQAGHKVALKILAHDKLPATGAWDYLLIGVSHARTLPPYSLLGLASRTAVVATDIQSHTDHQWAQGNACTLGTTEFLMTRTSDNKKADVTRLKLLEMLSLIAEDANTDALESVFRQEAKLSYSLLRLVNSAANAPRTPITSFAQAINLLGRRQLQRWLQLLVYADPNNGQRPNPLLQKAAARGRLMEILSSQLSPESGIEYLNDAAFMVGSFSLLDVLLNMSMGEILQQLSLPEPVRAALLAYHGQLGELLKLVNCAEARDFSSAESLLASQPFDGTAYVEAQLVALNWAAKINPMA